MKKRIQIILGFAGVLTIIILGFVCAVFYGFYHINGPAAKKYPIKGIDVSHYQGEIDWLVLSGQNIQFAYIKATEGSSHIDEKFAFNYEKARESGLKTGAYHFFSFDSPGLSQAEHFIHTVKPFEGMILPAVDVEFYGDKKEHPPASDQVVAELKAFLDRIEQTWGQKPVIYVTEESWQRYVQGNFNGYPIWFRDIWKKPNLKSAGQDNGTPHWTFWQYTNRGRLKGFSGGEPYVDLNVFYGTKDEWMTFCSPLLTE